MMKAPLSCASPDGLERRIVDFVCDSEHKVTPRDVEKKMSGEFTKKEIRGAVKHLVAQSELGYTQFYGRTFLEKSFNRAVRVSDSVVLKPPEISYQAEEQEIVVSIRHGESFGTGSHPTTRLSIQGIEHLFQRGLVKPGASLDIGTGSGILALVSVLLGMESSTGVDIDPCAVAEARENVRLNGLEGRIVIKDTLDEEVGPYPLVVANLRYPTLVSLIPLIGEKLGTLGCAVFSGIKKDEAPLLRKEYEESGFSCLWQRSEKQWSGIAFQKM